MVPNSQIENPIRYLITAGCQITSQEILRFDVGMIIMITWKFDFQQCHWDTCQISQWSDTLRYESEDFKSSFIFIKHIYGNSPKGSFRFDSHWVCLLHFENAHQGWPLWIIQKLLSSSSSINCKWMPWKCRVMVSWAMVNILELLELLFYNITVLRWNASISSLPGMPVNSGMW